MTRFRIVYPFQNVHAVERLGDVFLVAAREVLGKDVGPISSLGEPTQEQVLERAKGLV